MTPSSSLDERRVRALERIASLLRWTAAVAVVVLVAAEFADVLILIFAAALLALGLRGAANRLSRITGLGSGAALAVVVLVLAGLFGAWIWWSGPRLASEAAQLQEQLLQQLTTLRSWLQGTSWGKELLNQLPSGLGGSGDGTGSIAPRLAGTVAGAVWSGVGVLGTLVLILAAALYFAASPRPYINGPLRLVPPRHRQRTRHVLGTVGHTLQSWLAGQLLDMLVVGIVTGGGLALLGVPLAFVLGVVAGLLNFVPYIGAIGGAIPAVLIGLSQGPQQAMLVTALFVVVQTLEGNVLSPLIQRRAVDLPPAATILAQTALGALFGLPGIILATPIAAACLAALKEVTAEDE